MKTESPERRFKKLSISKEAIFDLIKPGKHCYESFENELPPDCEIRSIFIEYDRIDEISLILFSKSFEEVPIGQIIPRIDKIPTYKKVNL